MFGDVHPKIQHKKFGGGDMLGDVGKCCSDLAPVPTGAWGAQPYPSSFPTLPQKSPINKIQPPQTGSTPEFSEVSRVEFRRVGYSDYVEYL